MLYKKVKRYPEAVAMFRHAAKLDPHSSDAYKQLAATSALAFFVARGARPADRFGETDDMTREARTACR
jgi:hypothetical protein